MRLGLVSAATMAITMAMALGLGCRGLALDQKQVITWIDSKNEVPAIDVSGAWESTSNYWAGGWGSGTWAQQGAQVTGNLGPYTVEGRVSGNHLFAMILSNNRVYYTAIMELTKTGGITGMAVAKYLADAPEARTAERAPIMLVHPAAAASRKNP